MVTTISNTVNAFLIPHIKMLIEDGNQVDVAFRVEQEVSSQLFKLGATVYEIPFSRKIYKNKLIKLVKQMRELIKNNNYDIVHTHTPIASAIVRLACKDLPHTKVFYTAHGFHFYRGAPKINWLVYYPIEKYLSRFTDKIITINSEDYCIAKKFNANEVVKINGVGFDSNKIDRIKFNTSNLKRKLNIDEKQFVLLSVGELNKNKNHELVIRALSEFPCTNIKYIICGEGPLKLRLKKLVTELKLENVVEFQGFRRDVLEYYNIADIFIFPSFREGLSVSMMEAMSFGLPILASNIRGNSDLIDSGKGGFLFQPSDDKELLKLMLVLIENENMRNEFGEYNANKVLEYSTSEVLKEMKKIYL